MRNVFTKIIATLTVLTASTAFAGNNCCPAECDPCGDFNFYIGGNIGVGSHTAYRNDLDGALTDNSGWSFINTGFIGGGQIGLDWQRCNVVVGLIGDFDAGVGSSKLKDNPNATGQDHYFKADFSWISTIRGRLGIAVGDGLVYVTGGGAYARFKNTWQDNNTTITNAIYKHNKGRWGWTGGVGAAFDVGCNVTVGTEVLFAHFDNDEKTFEDPNNAGTYYTFAHSDSVWTGKIFVNYNFGDFSSFCCR